MKRIQCVLVVGAIHRLVVESNDLSYYYPSQRFLPCLFNLEYPHVTLMRISPQYLFELFVVRSTDRPYRDWILLRSLVKFTSPLRNCVRSSTRVHGRYTTSTVNCGDIRVIPSRSSTSRSRVDRIPRQCSSTSRPDSRMSMHCAHTLVCSINTILKTDTRTNKCAGMWGALTFFLNGSIIIYEGTSTLNVRICNTKINRDADRSGESFTDQVNQLSITKIQIGMHRIYLVDTLLQLFLHLLLFPHTFIDIVKEIPVLFVKDHQTRTSRCGFRFDFKLLFLSWYNPQLCPQRIEYVIVV